MRSVAHLVLGLSAIAMGLLLVPKAALELSDPPSSLVQGVVYEHRTELSAQAAEDLDWAIGLARTQERRRDASLRGAIGFAAFALIGVGVCVVALAFVRPNPRLQLTGDARDG